MFNLRNQGIIYQATLFLVVALISLPASVQAEAVGQFSATLNKVDHLRTGATEAVEAKIGSGVELKDLVTTLERSRAQVTFVDETVLRIASSSQVEITEFMFDNSKLQSGSIKMIRGTLRSIVHHTDAGDTQFEVRTPTAVAAVRGTDFFTIVMGNITRFVCNQGQVEIRNINPGVAGAQMCAIGQTVDVSQGQPPTPPSPTDPKLLDQLIKKTTIPSVTPTDVPPQGPAAGGVGLEALTALGIAGIGAIAVGSSNSGVPGGAIPPAAGPTTAVEDSIYVMQAWTPTMSFGFSAGSDAGHVMTVTRDAGGNITGVRIQGTHATEIPLPASAPQAFDYTFSTPVPLDPQSIALTGAGTPAAAAIPPALGPNEITINRIASLPIRNYQYVDLFHWGVEINPVGTWIAGIGVFGTLTPTAVIPVAGTATYIGTADGWFYNNGGVYPNPEEVFTATMTTAVDFTANTMNITFANSQSSLDGTGLTAANPMNAVMNNMVGTVSAAGWAAGTNTFDTTLGGTFTDNAAVAPAMTGTLRGGFFGPATKAPTSVGTPNVPANIAGGFSATDNTSHIVGVFAGQ